MSVQMTLFGYKNVLHVYLPLSSSPGMTISYFCHDAKRRRGGGPRLILVPRLLFTERSGNKTIQGFNIIKTLIFKKGSVPLQERGSRNWSCLAPFLMLLQQYSHSECPLHVSIRSTTKLALYPGPFLGMRLLATKYPACDDLTQVERKSKLCLISIDIDFGYFDAHASLHKVKFSSIYDVKYYHLWCTI